MPTHKPLPVTQAAMEQATGLSREVLRKWELRYQFPLPLRGARGQRLYAPADVARLQLINRLIHQGMRPGKLMPLSLPALQTLLENARSPHDQAVLSARSEAAAKTLLACLAPSAAPLALGKHLDHLLGSGGLAHFVKHYLPSFNLAVGEAWLQGQLSIYAEHRYTESVRQAVLGRVASLPHSQHPPRVLLTTPPDELHCLGLLALHAVLALQGADCVNLGPQTPAAEVVQAVLDLKVQVVAISVSACCAPESVQRYVENLRQQLPPHCVLWVGGQGSEALSSAPDAGWQVLHNVDQAVQAWVNLSQSVRPATPETL